MYGLVGVLIALPLLAVDRAIWEFFSERLAFEAWKGGPVPGRGRAGRAEPRRAVERRAVAVPSDQSRLSAYACPMAVSAFPATRLRRLRRTGALRVLVRETRLDLDDLVQPLFVAPEALPNERLPALARHTVDGPRARVRGAARAGLSTR